MAKKEFQKINLKGYCLWARIQESMSAGDDKPEGDTVCSMMIECAKPTYMKLKKMGFKGSLKDAEECFGFQEDGEPKPIPEELSHLAGKTFISIKRDVVKTTSKGVFDFKLPKVVDVHRQPLEADVGNGSSVIARSEIIPYAAGQGYKAGVKLNLVAVQVLDLIEYVKPEYDDSDDFEGFEDVPVSSDSDVNFDDVPFDVDPIDPAFG
jgi:hypothetical protein